MSFELFITRTFVPGINRRLDEDASPVTLEEFELLMDGAPIRSRLADGTCWLWHPKDMPWLAAKFQQLNDRDSYISLSISYSHNQFLKVWAAGFELALRMAKSIRARVFEDSNFLEVSNENVEELFAPRGSFVSDQAKFWEQTVTVLNSKMQAPLEYPIGTHDAVDDYFVFFLEPETPKPFPELIRNLGLNISPDSLGTDRFAIEDPSSSSLLSRVLLRPNDQSLQIWPFYWMEPFSRVALETLSLALKLHGELGGKLFFRDKVLTPDLEKEIRLHIDGLGVEFFLWWNQLAQ